MDVCIKGFNRNEASELTGMTYRQIAYLDRQGLVESFRWDVGHNSVSLLSWQQLLQLRAIAKLRKVISLQTIRKVLAFIEEHFEDSKLFDKSLIVIDNEVYWLEPENLVGVMLKVSGKNSGQFTSTILTLKDERDSLIEAAKQSKVIPLEEVEKRANVKLVA